MLLSSIFSSNITVTESGTNVETATNQSGESFVKFLGMNNDEIMSFNNDGNFILTASPRDAGLAMYRVARQFITTRVQTPQSDVSTNMITIMLPKYSLMIDHEFNLTWTGHHSDQLDKVQYHLKRFLSMEVME